MPPRKVTKTKTFAGCWTCRRRKVKCDYHRPTCRRCGEGCEGYNVELYWMTEQDEGLCSIKRRAMLIKDSVLPVQVELAEIDRMLEELDDAVNEFGVGLVSAFSAFPANQREQLDTDCLANIHEDMPKLPVQQSGAMIESHKLSVYVDPAMAELMHNYIHVVSDLLQPARHKHNPYRSLYIPKAIEAAADSLFVGATRESSHAGTALFHALLAVSAFHLHHHRPFHSRYGRLGRTHRTKAIKSLRISLVEPDEERDYGTTVSAMLSMVSIDLMEGSMSDFWIHLEGCENMQATRRKVNRDDDHLRTEQLLAISAFLNTLSRSTDPYLPPKRWEEGDASAPIDYSLYTSPFCTKDHSLEFTYGISSTLAHYMYLTILHSQHLEYYETHRLTPPDSLLRAAATLHEVLDTWCIDDEPLASISEADHETRSLVVCHILAFHAALVIYFHTRTSWPSRYSNSRSSGYTAVPEDGVLRHYKRICATNLLAAESLKASCGDRVGWKAMAPIVWPGFIAACEAEPDEQPLWRTWWMGVEQYRIGSIQILWNVVQEVWQWSQNGRSRGRPRWMEVLRCSGRRVMSG